MLTLTYTEGTGRFDFIGSVYDIGYEDHEDLTVYHFRSCGAFVDLSGNVRTTTIKYDGKISTIPSQYINGENDCYHYNVVGELDYSRPTAGFFMQPAGAVSLTGNTLVLRDAPIWSPRKDMAFNGEVFLPFGASWEYNKNPRFFDDVTGLWFHDGIYFTGTFPNDKVRDVELECRSYNVPHTKVRYGSIRTRGNAENYHSVISSLRSDDVYWRTGWVATETYDGILAGPPSGLLDQTTNLLFMSDFVFPSVPDIDRGSLANEATSALQTWDGNGLAFFKDMANLKRFTKDTINLLKGKPSKKALADLYLSFHYGWRLTVKDSSDLLKAVCQKLTHSGYSRASSAAKAENAGIQREIHYSIYYNAKPTSIDKAISMLDQWDLLPNLGNLWDLIPYSFVVDWFFNFGDVLDSIDNLSRLTQYDIIACQSSEKWTRYLGATILPGSPSGGVCVTQYIRSTFLDPWTPGLNLEVNNSKPFSHWVEGGALIIQKY